MRNAVIIYADQDADFVLHIEKALSLMKRQGVIKTHSRLNILPGENVINSIKESETAADVTFAVLTSDLDIDTLFDLIAEHEKHEKCLLVIYARSVDEMIIREIEKRGIPITPKPAINEHDNKDVAYKKIVRRIRTHFTKKDGIKHKGKIHKDILLLLSSLKINV